MSQVHRSLFRLAPLLLPLWLVTFASAEQPPAKDYIRFVENDKGAQLQTGITTFRNAKGVTVDLIGAIHIADHAYYAKLNQLFTQYDAMLYEMVGGPISKRTKRLAHATPGPQPANKKPFDPAAIFIEHLDKIPTAEEEPSLPGFVRSPFTEPHRLVYIKDALPGSLFTCPYTHRQFKIPSNRAMLEKRVHALEDYFHNSPPTPRPSAAPAPASSAAESDDDDEDEDAAAHRLAWLGGLTSTLQSTLGLESQLKGIDYEKPNFVHADMSLTQFTKLQDQRNEGFLSLWWRAMKAQMDHPELESTAQPGLLKILEILRSKNRSTELKRMVGRTFDSVEMLMAGVEGEKGTVIIAERNKVALRVLQRQIALGKKKLGIFYGAAHLADMQRRLEAMGFTKTRHVWYTAWDLPPEAPEPASAPAAK